ncbi:hypothetical protein [Streptomyces flavidovirens]
MRRCSMPALFHRGLTRLGPAAALTGLAIAAGAPVASADTNTSTEKSTMLCNVVLLSPGADVGGCSNVQVAGQEMAKEHTANTSLVDYAKAETVLGLLP